MPIILRGGIATQLQALGMGGGADQVSEATLRDLIHDFPSLLPIADIDRQFLDAVPICTELATDAGPIDLFLVTPDGLPILVECKLWRNPQARREVIGQILDYAKELSCWSSADVQRKVSQRLKRPGNVVFQYVRALHPSVAEADFNDALTRNLRRGRFLLLIVGDGIREEMAAIAEYVQDHAGLHFTLGLVEMPVFVAPDGARLVVPRVLARTETIVRTVVALPDGYALGIVDGTDMADPEEETPAHHEARLRRNAVRFGFWQHFLHGLALDDPEQPLPRASRGGSLSISFGAPGGSSWLTVYRNMRTNHVGIFLSSNRNSPGERAASRIAAHEAAIRTELGAGATVDFSTDRPTVAQDFAVGNLEAPDDRSQAIAWLHERTNSFVNALRPRIRAALADLET